VHVAADGEAGLEAAQAHRPHVVLLDIAMPGLTASRSVGGYGCWTTSRS
jgi:YesN/AraC family two-component response regulator